MKYTTILISSLLQLPMALAYNHSPHADATPSTDLDNLFQYTTSRNHKVISQAVDFVVSMQTAPTCTRMAASHLMNECKLLEHAPDFAKSRPEAYLDNVKTEYAAKLAICELLSAQPLISAAPPPHCDVLVPSSRACHKGRWWSQSQAVSDRQCYPEHRVQQYNLCLATLRSSPQYWTSFSNARQNAVVMCQASRDAIERENHLEIFKNLTQVVGAVSADMKHATDSYASLLRDQQQLTDQLRESQNQFEKDVAAVQEKALVTVNDLDNKFHTFMDDSISQLIVALADGQSAELSRIRKDMKIFSQDMIAENSQLARSLTTELQQHHDRAIISLRINHAAQVDGFEVLSSHLNDAQNAAMKINNTANSSLSKMHTIEHQLDSLSSKAERIARGLAFFSTLPQLAASLMRGLIATLGALSLLLLLYRFSRRLATYTAGACSAAYFLHFCGVYELLAKMSAQTSEPQPHLSFIDRVIRLNVTQKGVAVVVVLWLATYPVSRISTAINDIFICILSSYWIRQYSNDGGVGLLPSIEIPPSPIRRRLDAVEKCISTSWTRTPNPDTSPPLEP